MNSKDAAALSGGAEGGDEGNDRSSVPQPDRGTSAAARQPANPGGLLDCGLSYSRRGFPVIPLHDTTAGCCSCGEPNCSRPGKHPRVRWKQFQDSTSDEGQLRAWWKQWPTANVGIVTGQVSGLVVVDVDVKDGAGGLESWRKLRLDLGLDDNSPAVETPTGGRHFYYLAGNCVPGNSAGKLGAGLDVRGEGGYIVAPPSRTNQGEYRWLPDLALDDIEIRELPEGLANRMLSTGGRSANSQSPSLHERIPAGMRNETLASLAGSMRRRGMGQEAIEAALLAENTSKCEPPLTEDEVRTIAVSISQYPPASKPHPNTDLGNAERLVERYGKDLRYCPQLGGWHVWDGRRWAPGLYGEVQRMASDTVRAIYGESAALPDPNDIGDSEGRKAAATRRQDLFKHAKSSESASRQRAMLDLAWSRYGIAVPPEVWDADHWLLNCADGTLDLRTGELRPHQREDLLTKLAPVDYEPLASCPAWDAHLTYFLPDPDVRRQVQRELGIALVGKTMDETLNIWHGGGANGKTTTAKVLERILGDYAMSAAPDLLVQNRYEAHPTGVADLRGRRVVFSVELDEGGRLDEAKAKLLTGGDTIKARLMRQDFFSFPQTWSITLLCNHLPRILGIDEGIWRRIQLIPWTMRVSRAMRRPQGEVVDDLAAEGPGILRWMLAGLADWQSDHDWLARPVSEATAKYRGSEDRLGGFLADCCEMGPFYTVPVGDLYEAYQQWCARNGQDSTSKNDVGRLLRGREVDQIQRGHDKTRCWQGLRLRVASWDSSPALVGLPTERETR